MTWKDKSESRQLASDVISWSYSKPTLSLRFVSCLTNVYLMEVCHFINCSVINAVVQFKDVVLKYGPSI